MPVAHAIDRRLVGTAERELLARALKWTRGRQVRVRREFVEH
jgi:hypothetical protein